MPNMVDEILAQIPADDLAAQLGTDPDTAMDAARKALPALLGGGGGSAAGGGLGDLLGGLLGGEVEKGKADMPDLGGLFDMLGGGGSQAGNAKDVPDVGDLLGR